ncbi:MAG: hypothetical protein EXR43_05165 [Dehalococcoidia bacterium]|nr:hypothetical protein [Dehalococcoidia bacterium]
MYRPALTALLAAVFLAVAALLPQGTGRPIAHDDAGLTRGIVVGTSTAAHAYLWSSADAVHYFARGTEVSIRVIEYGENWIVGDQTWYMVPPEWANVWYVLEDGSYVYSAFVFIPSDAEVAPWYREPGLERYVIVDVSDQVA